MNNLSKEQLPEQLNCIPAILLKSNEERLVITKFRRLQSSKKQVPMKSEVDLHLVISR